jgi:cytidine deaminase
VGAAIFSKERQVISLGCNEVPKAGGGTYWSDCDHDHRDYSLGFDSNQKVREDLVRDTILRIKDANWLTNEMAAQDISEITRRSFSKASETEDSGPLHGSMIADVIEYGRMVHAEMNALADAARFGKSTADATLYCTTMPCHMCTKLIVAAGISRVVYLQPYGKSLVRELYADSVDLDDQGPIGKVRYQTLKGVTPNGFRLAFRKAQKRKDSNGKALKWIASEGKPTFISLFPYYQNNQEAAKKDFNEAISVIYSNIDESAPNG